MNLFIPELETRDLIHFKRGSRSDLGFEFRSAQRPFNQKGHIYAYARNGEGGISLRRLGLRC